MFIVAVCENKAREVGLAAFNVHLSQLVFTQFTDSFSNAITLSQLHLFNPREILLPHTTAQSQLATLLRERYGERGTNIVEVNRRFYNEAKGQEYVATLAASALALDRLESKFLSLASVAAIVKYYEYVQQLVFPNASLKFSYKPVEGYMRLDADTIKNLEIVRNLRSGDAKSSLFGMINFTKTAGGGRLLRSTLLQPLCDLATIETRLGCVDELLRNEKTFFELGSLLGEFQDLDHLAALQFVQAAPSAGLYGCEQTISNVIFLKQSLDGACGMAQALLGSNDGAGPQNGLLKTMLANLRRPEIAAVRERIGVLVEEDARKRPGALAMRTERYFAVKAGINGLLDVARKTYVEVLDDVQELLAQYTKEFLMDSLCLKNNARRGYFFSLPAKSKIVPSDFDVFIHVQKQGGASGGWTFTSDDLESFNERLRESGAEIALLTAKVVDELVAEVRQHLGVIHSVSDTVSMLDMFYSFASWVALSENLVRPELSESGPIAIKQGVHPLMAELQGIDFVPNDTYVSSVNNFFVIFGQNNAGKSTYIKQVAVLTLLAHIGSYVPAAWASFRLTDCIFSRIGTDDDMEHNSSAFVVEMREVSNILHSTTRRSLVIIDELGRGTSSAEGLSLAWAISEYLLSMPCYTLFTTHFRELLRLGQLYPNVKSYSLAADAGHRSTFLLTEGAAAAAGYGLRAAAAAGLPPSVTARANELKLRLAEAQARQAQGAGGGRLIMRHTVAERVLALRNSTLDTETLRDFLEEIKKSIVA